MMKIFYRLCIPVLLLSMSACTAVKPWERGHLARAEMAFTPDPMERKARDHIFHSKEGSSSVSADSGGGCGCN